MFQQISSGSNDRRLLPLSVSVSLSGFSKSTHIGLSSSTRSTFLFFNIYNMNRCAHMSTVYLHAYHAMNNSTVDYICFPVHSQPLLSVSY